MSDKSTKLQTCRTFPQQTAAPSNCFFSHITTGQAGMAALVPEVVYHRRQLTTGRLLARRGNGSWSSLAHVARGMSCVYSRAAAAVTFQSTVSGKRWTQGR